LYEKAGEMAMKLGQEKGICFICAYAVIIGICFVIIGIVHSIDNNDKEMDGVETVSQEMTGIFTAYTASVDETDDDPTITASNQIVRKGIVANNCLPFGTKIRVNDKIYEVQDRMNGRFGCHKFDIYMCDYYDAVSFGIKELPYEII